MTPAEIAEARKLCEAATPGAWTADIIQNEDSAWMAAGPTHDNGSGPGEPDDIDKADRDAAFIAAARTLLPAALDELEFTTRELTATKQSVAYLRNQAGYGQKLLNAVRPGSSQEGHIPDLEWMSAINEARRLTAELAATKAALAEAMALLCDLSSDCGDGDWPERVAALKAKAQP